MESFSDETKQRVVNACRVMQAEGMVMGTWGNVSVRTDQGIIITPSRVNYDTMTVDDLVVLDLAGSILQGQRVPSSESQLHLAVYRRRADVGCIVHNHSTYASCFAVAGVDIPPVLEEQSQMLGGRIRCTPSYIPAGHHHEVAELAALTLGHSQAVLVAHHGAVCCGKDLDEALMVARVLEKTARIYLLARQIGEVPVIPDELVEEERYRFVHKYGKEH